MTNFGNWLGKENGKTMLSEILADYTISEEQARATVTTYCILFEIQVDTKEWDDLMWWIYDNYNSWFDTFDELDGFMCALLV